MTTGAVIAALFVILTFGWIAIDAVRSHKKAHMKAVKYEAHEISLPTCLAGPEIEKVETKVRRQVNEMKALSPPTGVVRREPKDVEGEITPGSDTRICNAVTMKAEELKYLASKKKL